jgi:hypothetical protein
MVEWLKRNSWLGLIIVVAVAGFLVGRLLQG